MFPFRSLLFPTHFFLIIHFFPHFSLISFPSLFPSPFFFLPIPFPSRFFLSFSLFLISFFFRFYPYFLWVFCFFLVQTSNFVLKCCQQTVRPSIGVGVRRSIRGDPESDTQPQPHTHTQPHAASLSLSAFYHFLLVFPLLFAPGGRRAPGFASRVAEGETQSVATFLWGRGEVGGRGAVTQTRKEIPRLDYKKNLK